MVRHTLFALALLSAAPAAPAATHAWPTLIGGGPCAGTLQQCVDAATAGDTVLIVADELIGPDRYTAINEPVLIRKSLTLAAAPGIDAVFAPGFNLGIEPNVPGPHQVAVSGLSLRRGSVFIRDNATVAGSVFRIERLRIIEPAPPNVIGCAIDFQSLSPSPQFIAGDNVIHSGSAAGELRNGICASSGGSATVLTANVFRNRLVAGAATLRFGIALNGTGAGGSLKVSGNTVIGPRLVDGIAVQRAEGTAAQSVQVDNNVVALQDDVAGWGLRIEAGNSDVGIVNNSVVHGRRGLLVTGFDAQPVSGRVANNLIAFHSLIGTTMAAGALGNSHNLVFGNASDAFTPGPSTLSVDPRIERPSYPRPTSGSPALDAGSTADVPALALFDADGERRVAFGAVDIGAYEASGDGAAQITATQATTFFNEAYVTPFPVPLSAADSLVAVARWSNGPTDVAALNLGVYPNPGSPSGWSLFLQQSALAMPIGAGFHVLAPLAGKTAFAHLTSATNNSGALSTIDSEDLNGAVNRARIAIAFHRWDGNYHDTPIGLRWSSANGGRWQLRNEDGSAMPAALRFNIAVAPLFSPNAFRASLDNFAQSEWRLEHPLLDDNPCATPIVGRADDPDQAGDIFNGTGFGVAYVEASGAGASGRWVVRADAPSGTPSFPARAAFHVIVDGAQANRCRAPQLAAVFKDGFE